MQEGRVAAVAVFTDPDAAVLVVHAHGILVPGDVLHPDHAHHAHNNSGIFYPIVALDGYIVGNWSPSVHDGGLTLFDEATTVPAEPFHAALNTYRSTIKSKV